MHRLEVVTQRIHVHPDSGVRTTVDCVVIRVVAQLLCHADVVRINRDFLYIRPVLYNPLKALLNGHNLSNNTALKVFVLLAEEGKLCAPVLENQCCCKGDILPLSSIRKYL